MQAVRKGTVNGEPDATSRARRHSTPMYPPKVRSGRGRPQAGRGRTCTLCSPRPWCPPVRAPRWAVPKPLDKRHSHPQQNGWASSKWMVAPWQQVESTKRKRHRKRAGSTPARANSRSRAKATSTRARTRGGRTTVPCGAKNNAIRLFAFPLHEAQVAPG